MQHIPEALRDNEAIVLAAVKISGHDLEFASERLRNNFEIVDAAIHQNFRSFKHAGMEIFEDERILAFVSLKIHLKDLPDHMKNSKKLVLAFVGKSRFDYEEAKSEFREDRDVALAALVHSSDAFRSLPPCLKEDKQLLAEAVNLNSSLMCRLPEKICADRDFILGVVRKYGGHLSHASKSLKDDAEIVEEAMKSYFGALDYASLRLRNDKMFILKTMNILRDFHFKCVGAGLRDDEEVMRAAVDKDPSSFLFASDRLKANKALFLKVSKSCDNVCKYLSRTDKFFRMPGKLENLWSSWQEDPKPIVPFSILVRCLPEEVLEYMMDLV